MANSENVSQSTKDDIAIVLVPGSFCSTNFYNQVYRQLVLDGYNNVTPCPLLSASPKNAPKRPPPKMADDALYIREIMQAHLTRGRDVILVMNSYAGFPGTEALKDLPSRSYISTEERPDSTSVRSGAVVGLVHISSFLPSEGDSLRSMMGDRLLEPLKTGNPGGYMEQAPETAPVIFAEFAAEGRDDAVKHYFGTMVTHSSDSFSGAVSHTIWTPGTFDGKVVYLLGQIDAIVPSELAHSMIERVTDIAKEDRVKLVTIEDGGHCMHVSKPDVVVDLIKTLVSDLSTKA